MALQVVISAQRRCVVYLAASSFLVCVVLHLLMTTVYTPWVTLQPSNRKWPPSDPKPPPSDPKPPPSHSKPPPSHSKPPPSYSKLLPSDPKLPPAAPSPLLADCPPGRFVTITPTGRLGNKLCQYASLWAMQRRDASVRPTYILPEMAQTLSALFSDLRLPVLPARCSAMSRQFWNVSYFKYGEHGGGYGPANGPVLLLDNPCSLRLFHSYRDELRQQLSWHVHVREAAQSRLRQLTAAACPATAPPCTYVGVHVRRTDYGAQLKRMLNGWMVGVVYLERALEHCRRRYHRPVFVVSSDDLSWCRSHLTAADVVVADGGGSAGIDMALLANCNHTVMTHGTYGFFAAYLAGGDVVVPTGFSEREAYLTSHMQAVNMNVTAIQAV